jgi:predicted acylesterase/phospholipase RssA
MKPARCYQLTIFTVMSLSLVGCRSPYFADKGAALGGVAGGLAGAALGDNSGNAAGGAILGTAMGAITGAAIGDSMDAEVERRQALIEAQTGRRMADAVTTTDVMAMAASGLSDDVIVNHIHAKGVAREVTTRDVIELHENGVSESVINAMQQTATPRVVSAPVIIEEPCVVPHYGPPPRFYYRRAPYRHYRRHPGVTWGFSYSH